MSGATKLMTAGGGGVSLTPASSIASDVTVNVPVTGVSGGTLVCSDSSGNVGIGTSSPSTLLHLASATDPTITIQDTNESTLKLTAGGNANIESSAALIVRTGGTSERMRIDSSGQLLVGTTTTGATDTSNGFYVTNEGTFVARRSAGTVGYFNRNTSDGNVISFYRGSNNPGNISCTTTTTTYGTSSDYRLKENIQPMQNALGVVAQLNPVTYTWKADGSDGQGFIAHELQSVVPDCVTGEKDAVDEEGNPVYQGIDTSFLVATLTKAIQEQQAQIETLTAKVAALEAK